MNERCCRCHSILTSEDRYHYGASCETCNEDYQHAEYFDYYPIRCICRYARYQVRWVFSMAHHGGSLLLRFVHRIVDRKRSELRHDRRK